MLCRSARTQTNISKEKNIRNHNVYRDCVCSLAKDAEYVIYSLDKGPKDFQCSTDYEDRSSTPNILSPIYPLSHTLHTPKPSEPLQTD